MLKKGLVIVESPSKAKTIQKYLGRSYIVKASVGHIKDLPKSKMGVDPKNGFKASYDLIPSKAKVIEELKAARDKAEHTFLATDPDREGEAIAWHIHESLKKKGKSFSRVLFNAVTKPAILEALENPVTLNQDKVDAQFARRILDRLVGYSMSPLLWDKVKRGISAGRVQSVALRLIVDREKAVKAFKPEEYWELRGVFAKDQIPFEARLFKIDGENPSIHSKEEMETLTSLIEASTFQVRSLEEKKRSRKTQPPFTTSRLQQEAARKCGFSAKKTMMLAQRLYEGVDLGEQGTHGLITYMRTDSTRVEPQALADLRAHIEQTFGKEYVAEAALEPKKAKLSQDAHEAIRPTSLEWTPELVGSFMERDMLRLYQLIWARFLASQMAPAKYLQLVLDLESPKFQFRATGSKLIFPGFTAAYTEGKDEEDAKPEEEDKWLKLPELPIGVTLTLETLTPSQHFTQGPGRYSDASLIKDLEEKGIGRPSTYAAILSNLQDREYIEKRHNRFYPSELGDVVTELLVSSFPNILNETFTAQMESELDQIAEGTLPWKKSLASFWKAFEDTLETAKLNMKNMKRQEVPTDIPCLECGAHYVIRWGKLGSFLACSSYPECMNTQDFTKNEDTGQITIIPKQLTDKVCSKCQNPMIVKSGKFGKFLACSNYPSCKTTEPFGIGIHCPLCAEGEIAERQSRFKRVFYSCNKWPQCDFSSWDPPVERPCPLCQFPLLTEKLTKKRGLIESCANKECKYSEVIDANPQQAS
jgi:DNA topoisomerase I